MNLSFSIPEGGDIIPKKGTDIAFGDKLIQMHASESKAYAIASTLSIKPDSIFNYLVVVVGQAVEPGTVLAEKKSMLGKKRVVSDAVGFVDRIEYEYGNVHIRIGTKKTSDIIPAFFQGTITDINIEKATFTVQFKNGHEYDLKKVHKNGGGILSTLDQKDFFSITADDVEGHIVFLEDPHIHIISKLEALDVAGLLSINDFPELHVPSALLAHKKDAETLSTIKKGFFVFSELENKGVAYS